MSIKNIQSDWLTQLIAGFLDTFKVNNPKLFAILALVLLAVNFTADQGTLLGVFQVPDAVAFWIDKVTTFLVLILGARTVNFLPPESISAKGKY